MAISIQAQRVMDLSGEWQFQLDRNDQGLKEGWFHPGKAFDDTILLPGSMPQRMKGDEVTANTQWVAGLYDSSYYYNPYMEKYRVEGQVKVPFFLTPTRHYVGKAWYKRTIQIDALQYSDGQPIIYQLFLERPHIATTVWINGHQLGSTINTLSVPHVYNISPSDGLQVGQNTITILVDNRLEVANVGKDSHSVSDQTQGDWNGIVGRMELRPISLLDSLRVYPDVDHHRAVAHLMLGAMKGQATVQLKAESFNTDRHHTVSHEPVKVTLNPASSTRVDIPLEMGDRMLLWDEHHPQLYRLVAQVQTEGRTSVDTTYFGMRKIEARGKVFYVNSQPIQLRGTVENCDFPLTGYPPCDLEAWVNLFRTCRQWGLNHMRFHTYCPPEAAFMAADMVGFYLQPEGPSWPNHGVKLGRGEFVDKYLYDEAVRIMDQYGNHPSFTFFAFGNEPAGNWVQWSNQFAPLIKAYDPRHLTCGFSVGGGWAWQPNVDYAVKAGARGLNEWNSRPPESTINFSKQISTYNGKDSPGTPITFPFVSHETGQWCVFPDFSEIPQYAGVNRPGNLEIFRDLLRDNGMENRAHDFMMASGKLQTLCYKYEIERNLRTPGYEGFQLLSLNDYTGQGTALVGVTNVFFRPKGYCTAAEWREFCSDIVPLARISKFTWSNGETFTADVELSQFSGDTLRDVTPHWEIDGLAKGNFATQDLPQGQNWELGTITVPLDEIREAGKYTLIVTIPGTEARNHWDFWVYPDVAEEKTKDDVYITDSLDARAQKVLRKGGKVLICAAGKVTYGREVKQSFTPVFWNTSWFKMRPPHTTGIYVENQHPAFALFPTDNHSDLQWWELVNRAQVMQFTDFPREFQPLVQSVDTWFVSRKIGMLFEARVGRGRLMMTTMDITSDLDHRLAARQMRRSILHYMHSDAFRPTMQIDQARIQDLFTKVAGEVNMYTHDSPDELKPKLK